MIFICQEDMQFPFEGIKKEGRKLHHHEEALYWSITRFRLPPFSQSLHDKVIQFEGRCRIKRILIGGDTYRRITNFNRIKWKVGGCYWLVNSFFTRSTNIPCIIRRVVNNFGSNDDEGKNPRRQRDSFITYSLRLHSSKRMQSTAASSSYSFTAQINHIYGLLHYQWAAE